MPHPKVLFRLAAVLLFGACPTFAKVFVVGTCEPPLPPFATISLAVATAPPGSVVDICPGIYPEQVTITKSMSLVGIVSGNAFRPVITVPPSGLSARTDPIGYSIAAMVTVLTGKVNISQITVDGTGNTVDAAGGQGTLLVGIFYNTTSSGRVSYVTARNLVTGTGAGIGIWAENESAMNESVEITNNSIHGFDYSGIEARTNQTGSPYATVSENTITDGGVPSLTMAGGVVWVGGSGGKISDNVIDTVFQGIAIVVGTSDVTVSNNTVTNVPGVGLWIGAGVSVDAESNQISNTLVGMELFSATSTFKNNTFTNTTLGIEFNCNPATLDSNFINDATTGTDNSPAITLGGLFISNVDAITTGGCPSPPPANAGAIPANAH